INLARHVADQLMTNGSVKRAMLGVMLADLTPELAEGFGLQNQDGVIIQNVLKGSPAEHAGLRRNDVIVEFDGKPVEDMQKFRLRVADTPSGKSMPIVVLRDGHRVPTSVTLSDRDDKFLAQDSQAPKPTPPSNDGEGEQQAGLGLRV